MKCKETERNKENEKMQGEKDGEKGRHIDLQGQMEEPEAGLLNKAHAQLELQLRPNFKKSDMTLVTLFPLLINSLAGQ